MGSPESIARLRREESRKGRCIGQLPMTTRRPRECICDVLNSLRSQVRRLQIKISLWRLHVTPIRLQLGVPHLKQS